MIAILQSLFKLALTINTTLGLIFMLMCTALVIVSLISGDIKINVVRSESEKNE